MEDIAHRLVVALKELAIELGRTPVRHEFLSRVALGGRYQSAQTWAISM